MNTLCVYCSSSGQLDAKDYAAAREVGVELARRRWALVYGGGMTGLVGAVTHRAKDNGARDWNYLEIYDGTGTHLRRS